MDYYFIVCEMIADFFDEILMVDGCMDTNTKGGGGGGIRPSLYFQIS